MSEERLIAEQIAAAKEAVITAKKDSVLAQQALKASESRLDAAMQAATDYMLGNGLLECESFKLTTSYRVDVADIEAVPDEYIRVKTTKEVDKAKIRATKPAGNFYVMSEHYGIKLTGE